MAGFVSLLGVVMLAASARIQRRNADAAEARMRLLLTNQHKMLRAMDELAGEARGARLAAESAAEILGRSSRKSGT
jgi:hypothetical protein